MPLYLRESAYPICLADCRLYLYAPQSNGILPLLTFVTFSPPMREKLRVDSFWVIFLFFFFFFLLLLQFGGCCFSVVGVWGLPPPPSPTKGLWILFVTSLPTMNKTLKWLTPLSILTRNQFDGDIVTISVMSSFIVRFPTI